MHKDLLSVLEYQEEGEGIPPQNHVEHTIDDKYGDRKMEKRSCEWEVISRTHLADEKENYIERTGA